MITATNEDNMDLMARYPDNHFDLAIVDPPYGIGADNPSKKKAGVIQQNGRKLNVKIASYGVKSWDVSPSKTYFDELIRVSKNQIIFGVNYFDRVFGPGRIVWDKMNDSSNQFDCEIAYCSMNNRMDIVYYMWSGMLQGKMPSNKLSIAMRQIGNKKLNEERIHPTQKPVKLYEWLLTNYAKEGDKILDTHRGSGSLDVACHNLGFDLVTCELYPEYHNAANKRLEYHQKQTRLFQ